MDGQEKKLKIVLESENRANTEIDQVIVKLEKITMLLQQTMLATKAVAMHTSTSFDKVEKSATKVGTAINKSFNFKQISANVMRLTRILLNSMDKSVKYIENLNLFEVAMKKNIQSAHEFTSVLAESFGMDKSEIIRYQGLFANLAESMGNTTDSAYGVSKALTTVAYDLASLYNISTASAMEKLSAGLVGQTKPLRTIGIDTTYQTLEKYSKELGIDTAIKNLSQADKQLLRTIAIIRQSKNAWGDMAKTIETPANQLRVFASQISKVGRAIGNVFIGLFSKILPYANAFLMVVYELLTVLASLVGFEMPTYNKDNQYSTIADELDDAGDSADKLKKKLGLLSFDELNNFITKSESADASSSYGGILDSEINRLMDEYNDKLDKAKMKATEIRDKIMEWLGFTKKVNKETGEIYFAFEKITGGTIIGGITLLGTTLLILAKSLKIVKGLFGGIFGAKAVATTTAGVVGTTTKVSGLTGIFTTLANAVGLSVGAFALLLLAIGGIVALNVAIAMTKVVREIDIFKGASKETTAVLKPLIETLNDVEVAVQKLDFMDLVITDEDIAGIKANLKEVISVVENGIKKQKQQAIDGINEVFKRGQITSEEKDKMIKDIEEVYNDKAKVINSKQEEITKILKTAQARDGQLRDDERKRILELTNEIKIASVDSLSETEAERNKILLRMKDNEIALSKVQAEEILTEAVNSKKEIIANAEDRYLQEKDLYQRLRRDGVIESDEMMNQMIANAKETKDKTIADANTTYDTIFQALKDNHADIAEWLNKDTGQIYKPWQKFWNDLKTTATGIWDSITKSWELFKTGFKNPISAVVKIKTTFQNVVDDIGDKIKQAFGSGLTGAGKNGGVLGGLASGGIISQPMIYRNTLTGENYKKEAIIPLQNTRVIQDFSSVIGDNVLEGISSLINSQPIENRIYIDDTQVARTINKRNNELNNQFGK